MIAKCVILALLNKSLLKIKTKQNQGKESAGAIVMVTREGVFDELAE